MSFKPLFAFFLFCFYMCNSQLNAQNSTTYTIDYFGWNPSTTPCNIFGTPVTINNITHKTSHGQPIYSSSQKAIAMHVYRNSSNVDFGNEFVINFNFKTNWKYDIKIYHTISYTTPQNTGYANLGIKTDQYNNITASNTCNGSVPMNASTDGGVQQTKQTQLTLDYLPAIFQQFTPVQDFSALRIRAYGVNVSAQNVLIRKNEIIETEPTPTFNFSPSTLTATCGNPVSQTFTVNNVYNTSGITYSWSLGANNGWDYLGSPAPSTINTGTSNSITLTSNGCVPSLSNVVVNVLRNGSQIDSKTSTVSFSSPTLSITGATTMCPGTQYSLSVANIPCGGSTSWSVSPTNAGTFSSISTNSATFTPGQSGPITISASITGAACNASVSSLSSYIGIPADISGHNTTYGQIHCSIFRRTYTVSSTGATNYEWERENVT